jgi:hypothetical protein
MSEGRRFFWMMTLGFFLGGMALFRLVGTWVLWRAVTLRGIPRVPWYPMSNTLEFFGFVATLVVFYRLWSAVQDGHARTTAGRAVGFTLIPVFNLYWVFVMMHGFADSYNGFLERHRIGRPALSAPLFAAAAALWLLSLAQFLRFLWVAASVALPFVQIYAAAKAMKAIDGLPRFDRTAPAPPTAFGAPETPAAPEQPPVDFQV